MGIKFIEDTEDTKPTAKSSIKMIEGDANAPSSGFLMGLKDPISGGAQFLPKGLELLTSLGGTVPNPVSKFFGSEAQRVSEMVKAEEAGYQANRAASGSEGMDWSRLAGNVVNPANIAVGLRGAQAAQALGAAGRTIPAAAAGAAQAVLAPVTSEGDYTTEKATQIGIGAGMGVLGEAAAQGVAKIANPLVSKAEKTMRDLGITPTPGQTMGGVFKKAEDFAQNLPLVGEQIRGAREKVLFDYNKAVINKALDKVDDKLPASVVGRDAVNYAAEQISNKYDDVLGKMSFNLDFKTTSGILSSLNKSNLTSDAQRQEATNVLNNIVLDKFSNSKIPGTTYKQIESDLRKEASKYLNSASASDRNVGEALQNVLKTFKEELKSQNPKWTSTLRRIDSAYGDLSIMSKAAANTGAENGVFTPKQYQLAVKQLDVTRNKKNFARGLARGQELAETGMQVIGNPVNSTLEGRLALSAAGGAALLSNPQVAIPALSATSAMYSAPGLKVTDALLRQRPELAKLLGQTIQQSTVPTGGLFGYPLSQEANR
jgi:hypothetical protein